MNEQQLPNNNKDWQDLPPIEALLDHDDDDGDVDSTCALKQDASLGFIKDHIDLHSALYHQHILTPNQSMPSSPKRSTTSKAPESSSSKSKLKPMSGTGTITFVTKTTTTTTTITGFPVVDASSRKFDAMAQHVAQEAPSPNNSSSDSSSTSSSDEDDDSNDDTLSMDFSSAGTPPSISSKRQKHKFPYTYQRHHGPSTTTSTFTHSQAVSQSGATPKILKSKSMKKTPTAKSKRTTTSYDAETTSYLKRAFFNYYSKQYKLTREQREAVIRETGLRSRNITYWFSNHKRRLGTELAIYRLRIMMHLCNGDKIETYQRILPEKKSERSKHPIKICSHQ
ncbi:hypothetical protein MBANPS3_009782 [Mucor bainieri]